MADWLKSLLIYIRAQATERAVDRPLLNDLELQLLQQHALTQHDNPFVMYRDVQQPLLGERTSSFAGSGYEFAEHRRYANGDDIRFIDWRVMARTGKLYRKVFHEERRPPVYLVVDRRAPMRFGTHTQLKVTAAVRLAIRLLHQANQQQLLTGGVLLEQQAEWLRRSQGHSETWQLIQQFNRPCPPLPFTATTLQLDAVLHELAVRLSPGCIIFLLSDFHDLDDNASAVLYHLAQQHQLNAVQFLDPVEWQLPDTATLSLYDEQEQNVLHIDTANTELHRQFHAERQAAQQQVQGVIESAGGHYRLIMTDGGAQ